MQIKFLSTSNDFINSKNKIYSYTLGQEGRVAQFFNIEKMINKKDYYDRIFSNGYNEMEVFDKEDTIFKPITFEILKNYYHQYLERNTSGNIILYRKFDQSEINFFYNFSIYICLKGFHAEKNNLFSLKHFLKGYEEDIEVTNFYNSIDYPGQIRFTVDLDDERFKNDIYAIDKLNKLYGIPVEDEYERRWKSYVQPMESITKIIGVKKFYNVDNWGTKNEYIFTGEEKKIVLDLNNFDENVYDIFMEHNSILIE